MFHLTASKIQMSFTGFVLPWLPLKRSQAVNLFTQSKHKPESADFVLLGKCLSVKKKKKKKTRGLVRFLSSSFAASEWSLYCPFCPISPQRKGEIRTNLRSNPLHLSVLLQKLTSIQTITPSEPHRNVHFHQSAASLPLPSPPVWQHVALWECEVQLWLCDSWDRYSGNSDNTHQCLGHIWCAFQFPATVYCLQSHQPLRDVCSRHAIWTTCGERGGVILLREKRKKTATVWQWKETNRNLRTPEFSFTPGKEEQPYVMKWMVNTEGVLQEFCVLPSWSWMTCIRESNKRQRQTTRTWNNLKFKTEYE